MLQAPASRAATRVDMSRRLEACSGQVKCELNFESRSGALYADGKAFSIKGVNW